MKAGKSIAIAVLVLTMLAAAGSLAACEDLGGDGTTTTQAAVTSTTWPAGTAFIDEAADGGSVHLEVGDTLVLRLQGNPTTGYAWKFQSAVDPILVRQSDFTFTPESDLVGAGGTFQAVYLAVDAGITFLALDYVGPDGQVDHNYYIDVVIGDAVAASTTTETTAVVETTAAPAAPPAGDGGAGDDAAGDDAADDGAADDGGADDGAAGDDGSGDDSSSGSSSTLIRLDEGDDGSTITPHVGDRIEVVVRLHPIPALTAELSKPNTGVFDVVDVLTGGGNYTVRLRVIARENAKIVIEYRYPDGSYSPNNWSCSVKVE